MRIFHSAHSASAKGGRLSPLSLAGEPHFAGRERWRRLLAVALVAALADVGTKAYVAERIATGRSLELPGPLSLTHGHNSGAVLGFLSGNPDLVLFLSLSVLLVAVGCFGRVGSRNAVLAPALGLLVGGTLGNLIDRLRFGTVTDFLELPLSPAFNLADAFIVAGAALTIVSVLTAERSRTLLFAARNGRSNY